MINIYHPPRINPPNVEVRLITLPDIIENIGSIINPPVVIGTLSSTNELNIKQGIILPPLPITPTVTNTLYLLYVSENEMLIQYDYLTGTKLETGYSYLIRYNFDKKEYIILDKMPVLKINNNYVPTIFWQSIFFDGREYYIAKYEYSIENIKLSVCKSSGDKIIYIKELFNGEDYIPKLIPTNISTAVYFGKNNALINNVMGCHELYLVNKLNPSIEKTILLDEEFNNILEYPVKPFLFVGDKVIKYNDIIWDMENDVYYKLDRYDTIGPSIMYWDRDLDMMLGVAYYEPGNSATADPNKIGSGSGTREDPYVISYSISTEPERLTGVKIDDKLIVSYSKHLIETPNMWAEQTYHVLNTVTGVIRFRRYMFKNRIYVDDVLQESLAVSYGTKIVSIKLGVYNILKIARVW